MSCSSALSVYSVGFGRAVVVSPALPPPREGFAAAGRAAAPVRLPDVLARLVAVAAPLGDGAALCVRPGCLAQPATAMTATNTTTTAFDMRFLRVHGCGSRRLSAGARRGVQAPMVPNVAAANRRRSAPLRPR